MLTLRDGEFGDLCRSDGNEKRNSVFEVEAIPIDWKSQIVWYFIQLPNINHVDILLVSNSNTFATDMNNLHVIELLSRNKKSMMDRSEFVDAFHLSQLYRKLKQRS
ncbi:Hypothetical predicted protein [Octopus vulgaris]|uniref:Uncharacterized protein n=1 Tax=Octopus vulgaris TaxID=6645 RepID=A0AA36B8W6_OCTVU|nr:Hypothetical predicted protein [Octopus vulgaris]